MIERPCPGYDRASILFTHRRGAPVNAVQVASDSTKGESASPQSLSDRTLSERAVVTANSASLAYSYAYQSDHCELFSTRVDDSNFCQVPPMLSTDIEHQSVSLFYVSFVSAAHLRLRGHKWPSFFEALPEMLAEADPKSCLDMSMKAIVLANW